MAPGSDWLANVFLFTFLFGLVFTVVSMLLGVVGGGHLGALGGHHGGIHIGGHQGVHIGGHDGGHIGGHQAGAHGAAHAAGADQHSNLGHADIHFGGHDAGHEDAVGLDGPGLLNMPTIMAFLTWFGGAGYIFTRSLGLAAIFAVPMAIVSGLTGGGIMFVLLARLLWPMMSKPMSRSDYRLPGTSAKVVSPIRAAGVGEIVYTKNGSRFTSGARSVNEQPIVKGSEVVILKYERGIAYVQPVDELLGENEGEIVPQ